MKKSREHTLHYLWHSLEMRTIRRDCVIYVLLFGLMMLIALSDRRRYSSEILILMILLPFFGFYIWRTVCIFRRPEEYLFFQCKLTQPHSNPWLKMMYFSVCLEFPDGSTKYVDTHAIFASHGIMEPRMEDYVNQAVTIAYNPETGMVVVIG